MTAAVPPAVSADPPLGHSSRWPPPVRALIWGTLIARAAGFAYPFLAYRLAGIGHSPATAGLVLAAFGVGWFGGQVVAGWATDQYGYRATLLGASLAGAGAMPLLALGTGPAWLLTVATIAGAAYDAPRPAVSAALTDLVDNPQMRARVSGWRLAAINVGAAATGGIGGLLADRVGYLALCTANAASFIVFAAVAVPRLAPRSTRRGAGVSAAEAGRAALRDRRLWLLCASSLMAMTCAVGLMSALPMMMAHSGLSSAAYGWTQVVDGVMVLALSPVLTPVLSRLAGRPGPLLRAQAISSLVLGAGMGSAGLAQSTVGFSLAVTAGVPGEIALYIVATEIVTVIAPPFAIGTYHGAFGAVFAGAVVLAPLLAGWSMAVGGNALAGAAVVACGAAGALLCIPLRAALMTAPSARAAPAEHPQPVSVPAAD
ncbi:Major Facilitator Superfamily protein [Actinacidiphila alni]|uniref:Major Facilitator Superfamily protein n=1 Tax=Actinacidiphila alni TaxID=380248 RepID=A0A1I2LBS7_9ACTN|nr:MFS transporter [Actinacidiphila alni]SFF74526.1 Major Facilitator Superfamily protein [Actinacidiphila alni]